MKLGAPATVGVLKVEPRFAGACAWQGCDSHCCCHCVRWPVVIGGRGGYRLGEMGSFLPGALDLRGQRDTIIEAGCLLGLPSI